MNINFNPTVLSRINNVSTRFNTIAFKGTSPIGDNFEKSPEIKKVKIQTKDGAPIDAEITKSSLDDSRVMAPKGSKPVQFTMNRGNGRYNYYAIAHGTNEKTGFHLDELYADEIFSRKYKGVGTELLKCVVEESKKRGFKGLVNVGASNFPPPFAFYYKNNFKVISNYSYQNAAIEYAIRNNVPITSVIDSSISALPMQLDPKEADAFLNNKRTHEERMYETIDTKEIDGEEREVNLIQAPSGLDEEYYLQIINKSQEDHKQVYIACLREQIDENGDKYLEVFNINDIWGQIEDEEYGNEMIEKAAEKLGYDKVVINTERRRRRK